MNTDTLSSNLVDKSASVKAPDMAPGRLLPDRMVHFLRAEDGAVTTDWIILSSAIMALALGAILALQTGTFTLSDNVSAALADAEVESIAAPTAISSGYIHQFIIMSAPSAFADAEQE